jgi:hypothetical protein
MRRKSVFLHAHALFTTRATQTTAIPARRAQAHRLSPRGNAALWLWLGCSGSEEADRPTIQLSPACSLLCGRGLCHEEPDQSCADLCLEVEQKCALSLEITNTCIEAIPDAEYSCEPSSPALDYDVCGGEWRGTLVCLAIQRELEGQ